MTVFQVHDHHYSVGFFSPLDPPPSKIVFPTAAGQFGCSPRALLTSESRGTLAVCTTVAHRHRVYGARQRVTNSALWWYDFNRHVCECVRKARSAERGRYINLLHGQLWHIAPPHACLYMLMSRKFLWRRRSKWHISSVSFSLQGLRVQMIVFSTPWHLYEDKGWIKNCLSQPFSI